MKADDIGEVLGPAVAAGAEILNAEIDARLRLFDGTGLKDVYYLPGGQPDPTDEVAGLTTDDVTIVVEEEERA